MPAFAAPAPTRRAALRQLCALAALPAFGAQAAVARTTLNFDDLGASTGGVAMPAGYGGLNWGDRWFAMLDPVSGNNFLALGSGVSLSIVSADRTPFYFDGADFWSRRGADAVGDFYFVLYYQGATVYNGVTARKGRRVFTGTPAALRPPYTGLVDGVAFAFDGNGRDWNHLAMDNFRLRR